MPDIGRFILCATLGFSAADCWAIEPLGDADLASTSGQAGLTINATVPSVSASSIRYYDNDGMSATGVSAYGIAGSPVYLTSDGTSSGTASPGPCGGLLNLTCVNDFGVAGGSLNFNDFSLSGTNVLASMDVGSTGTGSSAVSGLLLGLQVNNLNINFGAISVDNGSELNGALGVGTAATNAPVYNASGVLTSGTDFGGIALTQLSISQMLMLVSAGAPDLGFSSGLTITSLLPFSMQFKFVYYNTSLQSYSGSGGFTPAVGYSANDGLLVVPVFLTGVRLGPIEIAAGDSGGGYTSSSSQGLDFAISATTIDSVDIGGDALGAGGIQVAGTDFGSVGLEGVHIAPLKVSVGGH